MIKLLILLVALSVGQVFSFDYAEDEQIEKIRTKHPKREVSVIVTDEGYYPETIVVFKDEKVKFFITSAAQEVSCFIVDKHQVFLSAKKGKVTQGEAIFTKAGKYKVYCPTSKFKGHLIVLDKKKKKKKKVRRKIASRHQKMKVWMPREY